MKGRWKTVAAPVEQQSLWDKMVLEERKVEAEKRGMRVCDLEEETSLNLAIEESVIKKNLMEVGKGVSKTATSSSLDQGSVDVVVCSSSEEKMRLKTTHLLENTDGNQADIDDEKLFDYEVVRSEVSNSTLDTRNTSNTASSDIPDGEIELELSPWQLYLPQDLSTRILDFLGDIDMCGYLSLLAKTNCFKPTESIYRSLCEFIYSAQSKKKKFNVENWKSWRNMLVFRPRLRVNGFYSLRTLFSRAPSHDSFWEEKITQSVEVKFYRHMRFFDNGRVLYSLDTVEPDEMEKHLQHGVGVPQRIFEGKYTLVGKSVFVEVVTHYAIVYFELMVLDGQDGYIGKHNTLRMIQHASAAIFRGAPHGAYWGTEKVTHKLPNNTDLQFWRHWNWNSTTNLEP